MFSRFFFNNFSLRMCHFIHPPELAPSKNCHPQPLTRYVSSFEHFHKSSSSSSCWKKKFSNDFHSRWEKKSSWKYSCNFYRVALGRCRNSSRDKPAQLNFHHHSRLDTICCRLCFHVHLLHTRGFLISSFILYNHYYYASSTREQQMNDSIPYLNIHRENWKWVGNFLFLVLSLALSSAATTKIHRGGENIMNKESRKKITKPHHHLRHCCYFSTQWKKIKAEKNWFACLSSWSK